jgi:hypothetical protein
LAVVGFVMLLSAVFAKILVHFIMSKRRMSVSWVGVRRIIVKVNQLVGCSPAPAWVSSPGVHMIFEIFL